MINADDPDWLRVVCTPDCACAKLGVLRPRYIGIGCVERWEVAKRVGDMASRHFWWGTLFGAAVSACILLMMVKTFS